METEPDTGGARSELVPPAYDWMKSHTFGQAVIVDGPLILTAGQAGISPDGRPAGEDFTSQLRAAFHNVEVALNGAGVGMEHVVKLTIYLADAKYLPFYAAVRDEFITAPWPVTAHLVAAPMLGLLVEIEATATLSAPLRDPVLTPDR